MHLLASSNINASYSLQKQDLLCQNTQTLYFSNEVVNKLASIHKSYASENMCDELPEQLFHKGPYSLYRLFYNEVPHVKTCFYEYWEKNES